MHFLRALVVSSLPLALGCSAAGSNLNPVTDVPVARDVVDAAVLDAPAVDAPAPVDVVTPITDSGCPAPASIGPEPAPAHFLAPFRTTLLRNTDGDTAHFAFPIVGDVTVRFVWVNTEESHGAETTPFGVQTAATVAGYLNAAQDIVVTREEDNAHPGQPNTDAFGRTLGLVFVDGTSFQVRLVREGLSAYYTEFGCAPEPLHTAMLNAEAEARANQRGIWAPGHPTDYRVVLRTWIGSRRCRPNPFLGQPYCS